MCIAILGTGGWFGDMTILILSDSIFEVIKRAGSINVAQFFVCVLVQKAAIDGYPYYPTLIKFDI